ncbi:Ig-like domain-containing protein [Algoriphagus machipongonensis]|uniref:SbsA Ig-like domain-containing protein n=1 Tax=Algoriphagus machipongonensis TaxID=388413 RepID=A3HSY7_9BACT|nr:Ig-like domain-containing protein [Algoriphagus machipongonensis]EAZ82955.2 hypothetical protein ALPR1_12080 [Algoriphagus machipongonensis]
MVSCSENNEIDYAVLWDDQKAIGIKIPDLLEAKDLEIRLVQDTERVSIFGELKTQNEVKVFKPIIPFTRGLTYEILVKGKVVKEISIPTLDDVEMIPVVESVFPSQDTVPENLLKVYLKFSQPMKEGVALNYIKLLDADQDTVPAVFLNLQPELWDQTGTQLTVWLDPGRIKRDLIPNLEMGAPLEKNQNYKLIVTEGWKSKNGLAMSSDFIKAYTVTDRDSVSPTPSNWELEVPKAETKDAFQMNFLEPLDYALLQEVFIIKSEENLEIPGTWELASHENRIRFLPTERWKAGSYKVEIETRLEDLAGNNLNRLFEIDLENNQSKESEEAISTIEFSVKN